MAAQNDNSLDNVPLNIGGVAKVVNIKIPCMAIIGDMQGGDKVCNLSASYNCKINRICRKCDVTGPTVGDPDVICNNIRMDVVKGYVTNNERATLKAMNQPPQQSVSTSPLTKSHLITMTFSTIIPVNPYLQCA